MNTTFTLTPETVVPFDRIPTVLERMSMPIHSWYHGENGPVDEFMQSIAREAITLHLHKQKLILHTIVAVPYIGYAGPVLLELYEAYQLYVDRLNPGKISMRSRIFKGSLGETMLRNNDGSIESGREATMRGLHEELGWNDPSLYDLSDWQGDPWEQTGVYPSQKYPGLHGVYTRYRMHCIITDTLYRPEGYFNIDAQKKKKEVFSWKEI